MLRSIDVIFRHPIKKFTVIYQSGRLWQLPQLDFDGGSLAYKRPYTGSREQIFVAQNQQLSPTDTLLVSKLATIDLPAIMVGANVNEFEQWWTKKSYDYRLAVAHSRTLQQQAITTLNSQTHATFTAQTSPQPSLYRPLEPITASPRSVLPILQTSIEQMSSQDQLPTLSDEADIFDAMLADLTQGLG